MSAADVAAAVRSALEGGDFESGRRPQSGCPSPEIHLR